MYTNLILFLVVIFLSSVAGVPEEPQLSLGWSLVLGGLLYGGYHVLATRLFRRRGGGSGNYFRVEKILSVTAVVFFAIVIFICEPQYYLGQLPLTAIIPSLVNFGGVFFFLVFLGIMWCAGKASYQRVFRRYYSKFGFIISSIKVNLPIILPWFVLSLFYDLVVLFLPFPWVQQIVVSRWGDAVFFVLFVCFVFLFFPPLVRRIWGCVELPEGELKTILDSFSETQNFKTRFYLWPIFEGRMITAAVMGLVPGVRYILLTPALIETMTIRELEAVVAHEIGHVKKRHLLLYVFLIGGFSLLVGGLVEPLVHLLLSLDVVGNLLLSEFFTPDSVVTVLAAVPFLLFMLFYFRVVFGYFIRNFERQADLYSLAAVGSSEHLISAFEKIAVLSGNTHEEPNWHHFSIRQRMNCLLEADANPGKIRQHNNKLRMSLLVYVLVLGFSYYGISRLPLEEITRNYQERYTEAVLVKMARQEPNRAVWQRLIGNLMLTRNMEGKAVAAYEKAFSLDPANPEIMNNYAWLLLTSEDLGLRDTFRALTLARGAAAISRRGYVLDTLATAYWANGLVEEAVVTEEEAIKLDPAKRSFYLSQIAKFTSVSYDETLKEK